MPNLTARSLKATLVLEPAQLAELVVGGPVATEPKVRFSMALYRNQLS